MTWIASLPRTPVSANTAIYQINPLLVYTFSIPLLREKVRRITCRYKLLQAVTRRYINLVLRVQMAGLYRCTTHALSRRFIPFHTVPYGYNRPSVLQVSGYKLSSVVLAVFGVLLVVWGRR